MTPSDWILDDGLRGRVARWWAFSMKPGLETARARVVRWLRVTRCMIRGHPKGERRRVERYEDSPFRPLPGKVAWVDWCDYCGSVVHVEVPGPPKHPNCRCSTTIEDDEEDPG